MNTSPPKNKAVLVLGMHRSGTSAVMRVINLLGADIGNDLLPPAADNPSGFWEHVGVVKIHDELLGALGRSWHDVRSLPDNWLDSEAAASARVKLVELLAREFSSSPLWAVKDPRLCRLLPLWHQVLDDLNTVPHAIFVVRHPDEVAQSVLARDGIPVQYTRLAWLEHMMEAEVASRSMLRVANSYEDLLLDWQPAVRRISEELDVKWPVSPETASAGVDQFLNKGAQHHKKSSADRTLPKLSQRAYDAFLAKARATGSDWSAVERVNDLYQASADVFLQSVGEALSQVVEKVVEIAALSVRLENVCAASREIAVQTYLHGAHVDVVPMTDFAKVYYRKADESYSEERAVKVPHQGLWSITSLRFELPSRAAAEFLRFDPSELPGEFSLRDLVIDGNVIGLLDGLFSLRGTHVVAITDDELRLASIDNDPHVELDCRGFGISDHEVAFFQLSCCRITPYIELGKIVNEGLLNLEHDRELHEKTVASNLNQLQEKSATLGDRVNFLVTLGEQSSAHVAQQASELSAIKQQMNAYTAQQTAEIGAVNERMDALIELQSRSLMQRFRHKFHKRAAV